MSSSLWLSQSCWGQGLLSSLLSSPRSVCIVVCSGRIGILSLGEELLGASTGALWCCLPPLVWAQEHTVVGTAPTPSSIVGMQAISLDMSGRCCACNATSMDSLAQIC